MNFYHDEKLSVRNIQKSFGDNLVLQDVSLNLKDNEFVSLIASGSGKAPFSISFRGSCCRTKEGYNKRKTTPARLEE